LTERAGREPGDGGGAQPRTIPPVECGQVYSVPTTGRAHLQGRAGRVPPPWTCARAPPPLGTFARSTAADGKGVVTGSVTMTARAPQCRPQPSRSVYLQRDAGQPLAVAVVRVAHGCHQAVDHAQMQQLLSDAQAAARQDPRWGSGAVEGGTLPSLQGAPAAG
jgi:hypothetical protein